MNNNLNEDQNANSSNILNDQKNGQISIFEHPEFGKVRTIIIDNKPMFVAVDVARALNYNNTRDAIATHCKSGDGGNHSTAYIPHSQGVGGTNLIVIDESNVYRLIMRSNMPRAIEFQDWVVEQVLPSIRKTGSYTVPMSGNDDEAILYAMQVLQKRVEESKLRIQTLENENQKLLPKAEYVDKVLQSDKTYTSTQMAKELGMAAITLHKKLAGLHIMFEQSGQWFLYHNYQGKGYTEARTYLYTHSDGTPGTNTLTVWTEYGKAFLHMLRDKGKI